MSGITPSPKMPKLIVVIAFDRGEDGELLEALGPSALPWDWLICAPA